MATLEDAEEVFKSLDISEYDLRILDPDLPPANMSVLLPKKKCIMLGLNSLSIIVSDASTLYIESSEKAFVVVEEITKRLKDRFTHGIQDSMSNEVFVLDTVFDIFLTTQTENTFHWEREAAPLIEKIERGVSDGSLQKLKSIKSRLNRMVFDTDTVKEVLGRALMDETADRIRLTLEIYYMSFNVQTSKIKDFSEEITGAETTNSMRVDAQRNQLLKFELVTLVFTLGLTVVSAVSGIFGQNLSNSSFTDVKNSFVWATSIYCTTALTLVLVCLWYFKRIGIL